MINYRVKNLRGLLQLLKKEGVATVKRIQQSPYGLFAWVEDPDGNRIELWEPPKTYKAPETEISSE